MCVLKGGGGGFTPLPGSFVHMVHHEGGWGQWWTFIPGKFHYLHILLGGRPPDCPPPQTPTQRCCSETAVKGLRVYVLWVKGHP